jgi:uncharacterized protein (DUF1778 family)
MRAHVSETPVAATKKLERFAARIRPEEKRMLERAARLTGRKLTDFVMGSARDAALQTIERYEHLTLVDPRDRAAFVDAMLNPPTPSVRLREAAQRYREVTEEHSS